MEIIKVILTALLSVAALFIITKIMGENLSRLGRDEKWLSERLKLQGYKSAEEIFLAVYVPEEDKLTVYLNE